MKSIQLASGYEIPRLGLGTWELVGEDCSKAVAQAIELGYRHIDTAFAYRNHREVAAGIAQSQIAREELFITTKIPFGSQKPQQVRKFAVRMQDDLATDYVDLLLIHWPDRKPGFSETLAAMNELVDEGLVRSVGISNFNSQIMAQAKVVSEKPIVTNQVEFHPYLYQRDLLEKCRKEGIVLTAYSPLARGKVFSDNRLQSLAETAGISVASVVIAWLLQKGLVVIPKATSLKHLQDNLAAEQLELPSGLLEEIDSFPEFDRIINGSFKHYPFDEEMQEQ